MERFQETAVIIRQDQIASDIYSMWLSAKRIAAAAKAGQFLSVYCWDGSRLLPRPISICEIDREGGAVRLVYRVVGGGTDEFSRMYSGMKLSVVGPSGNGYPVTDGLPTDGLAVDDALSKGGGKGEDATANRHSTALLIGGGLGIPPMLELAREMDCEKHVVLGFRNETFLLEEFYAFEHLYVATDDGGMGTKGTVLDAICENGIEADVAFACGPAPMLRAVRDYAALVGMECWVSLEERMACGIGACLSCVCKSAEEDGHSHVCNKRVCMEGPVFRAQEVVF